LPADGFAGVTVGRVFEEEKRLMTFASVVGKLIG